MIDRRINLYNSPHADIVGATGSGKSTLALALFEAAPGVAFYVDPSGDETGVGDVTIDYSEGEHFDPAILQEHNRIRIIPPHGTGTDEDMAFLNAFTAQLFELGEALPHDKGRFFVFVDEAHEFAPLHAPGDNPLIRIAKRGRKRNIRFYPVSQSPADMSKKMVKQMNYHVVFALNNYSIDYLKNYGMPADEIKATVGHKSEHKFVIFDGFDLYGPFKLSEDYV